LEFFHKGGGDIEGRAGREGNNAKEAFPTSEKTGDRRNDM
jgi:hypothetical protein